MRVLVSTDTSCLINYEVLKKFPIKVFPLNVIIDGKEYLDGINIDQAFLNDAMRANKIVKTSTPPLGNVIEYFEKIFAEGYDHVIHFTISSKLSSMYSLFTNVSENYFDNKISVIDSYALSTVMLADVLLAYDEVKKGTEVKEIVEKINARKNDYFICFIPENLNALKNGGRISPTIAAIGNTLKLKPLLLIKDGEILKGSMIRFVKKTLVEKFNLTLHKFAEKDYDYSIVSFDGDEKIINEVKEYLIKKLECEDVVQAMFPINVCAHCGPGTIGLFVSKKINGQSLIDYIK